VNSDLHIRTKVYFSIYKIPSTLKISKWQYVHITVGNINQRTLFVSYLAPVQLKAFLSDGSEVILYQNLMSNSPFGMVPLRFKYESESAENSLAEGNRLMGECEDLNEYQDINSGKEISYEGLPTMVDGKVKFTWSQVARSMQSCYVCGATWKQMAHRHSIYIRTISS
jgi:hypothetical protein